MDNRIIISVKRMDSYNVLDSTEVHITVPEENARNEFENLRELARFHEDGIRHRASFTEAERALAGQHVEMPESLAY
jgi:hypothetical protein